MALSTKTALCKATIVIHMLTLCIRAQDFEKECVQAKRSTSVEVYKTEIMYLKSIYNFQK